jgi:hypothetical protein
MDPKKKKACPVCEGEEDLSLDLSLDRRDFLRTAAVGVAATAAGGLVLPGLAPQAVAAPTPRSAAEVAVAALYETLTDQQKRAVCFDWDYNETTGQRRGLLRTRVSNNWQITRHHITSDFFTQRQRGIIYDVFRALYNPDWHTRILRQLHDDTGGRPWGAEQSLAIFGRPGTERFQFVMTGRHMTTRADGGSNRHMAFGGPIFYGHAASGFNERVGHPGNVFWEQGRRANLVYQLLSGRQQAQALVERRPAEAAVGFRGPTGQRPGIPVSELTRDQREELGRVLGLLVEPFRSEDRDEVRACLQRQGGLERCNLAFYRDGDIGNDGEWDNWRLEGPAFVWYFRGQPHVHVWVNVGDDPATPLNAHG